MLPRQLERSFQGAIQTSKAKESEMYKKYYETKEEKMERLMKQLGIEKHGKGKRKKKNKKKGGKK
jgi:hypothetical protein